MKVGNFFSFVCYSIWKVSKNWREIIVQDKSADKRRKLYIKHLKEEAGVRFVSKVIFFSSVKEDMSEGRGNIFISYISVALRESSKRSMWRILTGECNSFYCFSTVHSLSTSFSTMWDSFLPRIRPLPRLENPVGYLPQLILALDLKPCSYFCAILFLIFHFTLVCSSLFPDYFQDCLWLSSFVVYLWTSEGRIEV